MPETIKKNKTQTKLERVDAHLKMIPGLSLISLRERTNNPFTHLTDSLVQSVTFVVSPATPNYDIEQLNNLLNRLAPPNLIPTKTISLTEKRHPKRLTTGGLIFEEHVGLCSRKIITKATIPDRVLRSSLRWGTNVKTNTSIQVAQRLNRQIIVILYPDDKSATVDSKKPILPPGESIEVLSLEMLRNEKLIAAVVTSKLQSTLRRKVRQFRDFVGPLQEEEIRSRIKEIILTIPGMGSNSAYHLIGYHHDNPDLDSILRMSSKELKKCRNFGSGKAMLVFKAFEAARADLLRSEERKD